jgi:hypothetical protein
MGKKLIRLIPIFILLIPMQAQQNLQLIFAGQVPSGAPPTPATFVQSAKVVDGTNSQVGCITTCSFTALTPVVSDMVLVSETVNCSSFGNITTGAPTDNQTGNTYTKLAASDGASYEATSLWGSIISGTGSPFTVTGHESGGAGTCVIYLTLSEFANCTLTVDQSAVSAMQDALPPEVVSITTSHGADVIISVIAEAPSGNMFWSPVSGFTQVWPGTSPFGGWYTGTWYNITTTTGTFTSPNLDTTGMNQCTGSGCSNPGPSGGSIIVALKQ